MQDGSSFKTKYRFCPYFYAATKVSEHIHMLDYTVPLQVIWVQSCACVFINHLCSLLLWIYLTSDNNHHDVGANYDYKNIIG